MNERAQQQRDKAAAHAPGPGAAVAGPRQAELSDAAAKLNAGQRVQQLAAIASATTAAARPNRTGLPDALKAGVESLSGMAMDHVRVHYNSAKPAQLNALAYAQGSEIHVGPGQQKHLPHEAWHVVQQAQGRVRATTQMAGGIGVNDDVGLEREADLMGARALSGVVQAVGHGKARASDAAAGQRESGSAESTIQLGGALSTARAVADNLYVGVKHSVTNVKRGLTLEFVDRLDRSLIGPRNAWMTRFLELRKTVTLEKTTKAALDIAGFVVNTVSFGTYLAAAVGSGGASVGLDVLTSGAVKMAQGQTTREMVKGVVTEAVGGEVLSSGAAAVQSAQNFNPQAFIDDVKSKSALENECFTKYVAAITKVIEACNERAALPVADEKNDTSSSNDGDRARLIERNQSPAPSEDDKVQATKRIEKLEEELTLAWKAHSELVGQAEELTSGKQDKANEDGTAALMKDFV